MTRRTIHSNLGRWFAMASGTTGVLWIAFVWVAGMTAPPQQALAATHGWNEVPFKGKIMGTLQRTGIHGGGPTETDWEVTINGTGEATQLGHVEVVITNSDVHLVDPAHLGP